MFWFVDFNTVYFVIKLKIYVNYGRPFGSLHYSAMLNSVYINGGSLNCSSVCTYLQNLLLNVNLLLLDLLV